MNDPQISNNDETGSKRLGCFSIFGLMLITVIISVAITVWFLNFYLFPKRFEAVELSAKEQQVLEQKLSSFEGFETRADAAPNQSNLSVIKPLEPLAYSEQGGDRLLELSERELNGILANNTALADKLAIDLSDELISARLRLPMDPDFPFFGGKLLKARAGIEVSFQGDKPVVILKGLSVMGVPIPNSWLGGLKNIDLVSEFGQGEGFWKSFAGGVEHIQIVDGKLQLTLKE